MNESCPGCGGIGLEKKHKCRYCGRDRSEYVLWSSPMFVVEPGGRMYPLDNRPRDGDGFLLDNPTAYFEPGPAIFLS
jgi:hypothetical protein